MAPLSVSSSRRRSALSAALMMTTRIAYVALLFLLLLAAAANITHTLLTQRTRSLSSAFDEEKPQSPLLHVHIVVVSSGNFINNYAAQTASMRAYAHNHGYNFTFLDPHRDVPVCTRRYPTDFFFQKQCAVGVFLRSLPPRQALMTLDGDVVAGSPGVPMDKWLRDDDDIVLYERDWTFELAAGGTIVRNTNFGHEFFDHWQNYYLHRPRGFSSADNGAIHLAVNQLLGLPMEECVSMYHNLVASVDNLKPFYQFVACTRRQLGPPRRWPLHFLKTGQQGSFVWWPRYHGSMFDSFMVERRPGGPIPFYHGEKAKSVKEILDIYGFEFRLEGSSEWTQDESVVKQCAEVPCSIRIQPSFHRQIDKNKGIEYFTRRVNNDDIEDRKRAVETSRTPSGCDICQMPIMDLTPCTPSWTCEPLDRVSASRVVPSYYTRDDPSCVINGTHNLYTYASESTPKPACLEGVARAEETSDVVLGRKKRVCKQPLCVFD